MGAATPKPHTTHLKKNSPRKIVLLCGKRKQQRLVTFQLSSYCCLSLHRELLYCKLDWVRLEGHPGWIWFVLDGVDQRRTLLQCRRKLLHLLWSPLDTRRCCDVESTSLTLIQRRNNVVCREWSSCWCFYLYIAGLHDITACQPSPVLISG